GVGGGGREAAAREARSGRAPLDDVDGHPEQLVGEPLARAAGAALPLHVNHVGGLACAETPSFSLESEADAHHASIPAEDGPGSGQVVERPAEARRSARAAGASLHGPYPPSG